MKLSLEQEKMAQGAYGQVLERQMRLLLRLGEIYHAQRLVPIGSAQISGVSYKSIGDPGLEFLEDIAQQGVRVKTLTLLNPAGMDLENWREYGFPEEFAQKQQRIIAAFAQMGAIISATCTPYLAGNLPRYRETLAWSESSAVSFANSVIGARTNREGGPSALAAALCGCTPEYGLHLDDNRRPAVVVQVRAKLTTTADFGALGYRVGQLLQNKIPYFTGIESSDGDWQVNTDHLKALGAAMAASGAVALYHIQNITPEAALQKIEHLPVQEITQEELAATYAKLNTGQEPDIVMIGCPHASMREIIEIARKLKGKKLRKPLWVCTSRVMKQAAVQMGLAHDIEAAGGKLVADTCMVVAPIEQMGIRTTAVNSGKAANYLPGFCKQSVVFHNLDALLES